MPDATLTKAIDDIMRDFVSPQGPGVAVLIGRGDRVLVRKAYGLADVEQKQSLVPENRFIIGSVTKQFVGMCVMMLKHGGLLDSMILSPASFPAFPSGAIGLPSGSFFSIPQVFPNISPRSSGRK